MPCKHFNFGQGTCPFGSSCFYAHTDKAGRPVLLEPRRAVGAGGTTVLPSYRLSDYLFPEASDHGALSTEAMLARIPLAPAAGAGGGDEAGGEAARGDAAEDEASAMAPAVDLN